MAFEGLAEKLQQAFRKLSSRGKLTEADVKSAMREVRMALLEADVNYKVVKDFIARVTERAVGSDIMESLTPSQQVIKIVKEELTALMGGQNERLTYAPNPPTVYMLCGLQGAGKTTMAGKLAQLLKKQGKKPLLTACDIYRPAAITQLQVVAEKVDVPVFERGQQDVVETARLSIEHARKFGFDPVILDTAGRLHIDEALMGELRDVKAAVKPQEILLVVDSMTGQDAVNVADTFNKNLGIDGVILTKLDGDTRGGAAISVKAVTGKPIKFSGTGEKLTDIEPFHPDRMASRILGMGDILTIIEMAEKAIDEKNAAELERKMRTQTFDLNDYLLQMQQMKKMGSFEDILKMIPGIGNKLADVKIDEKKLGRVQAIIQSMTMEERHKPELLGASRKRRIAAGSGTTVQEINLLLKQFEQSRQMMKQVMSKRGGKRGRMRLPFMKP